jgi:hypothetical protein
VVLTAFRERQAELKPGVPALLRRIGRLLPPRIIDPWALATYLILPSLAFSLVYRGPRLVLDPLLLLLVEASLPVWSRRLLRMVWIVVCGAVVLMEWNIYPESYLFYATMLSRILFTPHGAGILGAMVFTAGFLLAPSRVVKPNLALLGAALVLYAVAVAAKGPIWMEQKHVWLRVPLGRAVQAAIFERARFGWSVNGLQDPAFKVSHELYDVLGGTPDAALPPKVMVFMMESWGERGPDLEVIRKGLMKVPGVETVASGYDHYRGSTLPGEVRELCGARLDFNNPKALGSGCLPRRFRSLGYTTTAFHGYEGIFYSRDVIYPALGFQKIFFKRNLKDAALCGGAFPGRCDDETASLALAAAARPGAQCTYMMTLSAHAFVDPKTLDRPYVAANPVGLKTGSDGQKLNRALVRQIVRQAAANPDLRGAMIYFSGDHNPAEEAAMLGLPDSQTPFLLVRLKP